MSTLLASGTLPYFTDQQYGTAPVAAAHATTTWHVLEEGASTHGGLRRQIRFDVSAPDGPDTRLTLLVNLPDSAAHTPVPVFVGFNRTGNHSTTFDPAVLDLTDADPAWGDRLHPEGGRPDARGSFAGRWDYDHIVARGYASVTLSALQIGPDADPALFDAGPHRTLGSNRYAQREPGERGAIAIWAWTLSRVLDALNAGMVPEIDATRAIVHGHSRLGKTALWAGANAPRWASVISNASGACGAALSQNKDERPQDLSQNVPSWFVPRFTKTARTWQEIYEDASQTVPDQPDLLAVLAPRPRYVSSASEDALAGPEGEFRSWQRASAACPGGTAATRALFPAPTASWPQRQRPWATICARAGMA